MGAVTGAPAVSGAFKGATIPELLKDVAGTIPGKIVRPGVKTVRGLGKLVSDAEVSGMKAGGKVKKYSGKEGSEVKKALGPREQADVSKMEKMQKQSKTPIGDIEPVPGHYGEKKYAAGGKVKKMANGGMFGSGAGAAPARGGTLPTYNVSRNKLRDMSRIIANIPTHDKKADMGRAPDMRALAGLGSIAGMKKGGKVEKEPKGMMKKEIAFFKKKKAPKSMIKHEEKEAKGMNCGGKVMKYAKGGSIDGCAVRGKTKLKRVKM
jgi:hypothetical protein